MPTAPTNTPRTLALGLAIGVGIAALTGALAGPLDPPPGPVAPTNKTLQQVEPRTQVTPRATTIAFTQPGSYYLAGNIDATTSAIEIRSGGITLDLNGFSLVGNNSGDPNHHGLRVTGSLNSDLPVVIRNTASGNTTDYDLSNARHGSILALPANGGFATSNSFANILY